MASLQDLQPKAMVRGILTDCAVTVVSIQWFGSEALELTYKEPSGKLGSRLLYRHDEPALQLAQVGRPWSFDGDPELFRLVSEAYRIHLAWLFDPYLAVTTSMVEPLPHQISAVYEEMIPRQPMRFLLADDPGAGKTIMAGLLIKELLVRGDLERCLIVPPGSLTDQWQDELYDKFGLDFAVLSGDMIRDLRTANPFDEKPFLIARLDQLSRNPDLQAKFLASRDWDLVIVDEAHRMSGHFLGGEVKLTQRYKLGRTLGSHCRNFLLMTATPHNGKEEDFQLFLALLDGDRFEGKFRDGVHVADPADLMRRLVKEDLYKFDGTPLFPERCSYTPSYELSGLEAGLYHAVTDYVREEMNRAERFAEGEGTRRVNVGFALMTLQRRLASSPEAIYQSLIRRRERLEARLRDERIQLRGRRSAGLLAAAATSGSTMPELSPERWDEIYEDAPQDEREEVETALIDNATAAQTIDELQIEIRHLEELERLAKTVRHSGTDSKWTELGTILDHPLMKDADGARRKLVVFTEFKDTLFYLADRIRTSLGRHEAVVIIHGGVTREDRRKAVHAFMNDPEVVVLVANDAAGEGVNLQRAHLMVNYDLPWNPNRLEQRFGRIHRIGQQEVCHLWNLVAKDTREGDVYIRLLDKLEEERKALGGKVFDVLGQLFEGRPLRELLMDAIRYGEDPEVRAKLDTVVDGEVDRGHLRALLDRRALVQDAVDTSRIDAIREEMERAHARRLQPHFIQAFFLEAFRHLGGKIHPREAGRFEITHVPQPVRDRDRIVGRGAPVLHRYERVCFEKEMVDLQPRAHLICPGSPLLDATIDLVLERYRELLKRGAILVDENDPGEEPRLLFYLEHAVQDGRADRNGDPLAISRVLRFVEAGRELDFRDAGIAPYLDFRPATEPEREIVVSCLDEDWMQRDWDQEVLGFGIREIVPAHLDEVRERRMPAIAKIEQEVRARLQKEINHWYHRAETLKLQERAGKKTRLPASVAQDRGDRLTDRLEQRLAELERERRIAPETPQIRGGGVIIPAGLLRRLQGEATTDEQTSVDVARREFVEQAAMDAVMAAERSLGREPQDVSVPRGHGYDIESRDPTTGELYFIEVKGRSGDSDQVTLYRTEVLCALNEPKKFRLAVVVVEDGKAGEPVYVRDFDFGQPGFAQTYSTYSLARLLKAGGHPS